LLERTTRKVALTDAGRAFFERAREALAGLEQANALALDAAREAHGVVRIAMPPDFGGKLGAALAPFLATHPRIRIETTFTTRGVELVGELVDLAIAFGRLPDSQLVARRIGVATDKLYAAPAYLAERGTPRTVADLARHDTVLARGTGGECRWELVGPRGVERVAVRSRLIGEHIQFITDGAIAGLGIALLPDFIGARAIVAGELRAVLPRYAAETALSLVTHGGRHVPRRVSLLRDYLVEALTGPCKAHGAVTT
jgi:DNA-binding transcriptional LysR family regulator